MSSYKIDQNTPNGEIGIFITSSGTLTPSDTQALPHVCNILKCRGTPGVVKYVNLAGETHEWYLETGETVALAYTQILATGTTATLLYWGITGNYIGNQG